MSSGCGSGQSTTAQTYPTKPITVIVPFGAGSSSEIMARVIGEEVAKVLGQPLVVEARPGANGAIGSGVVAKSAPDGYTLLFTASSTYALNPNLMKDIPYDQIKDFVPVAAIARNPWFLIVPAKSPFQTVADIVKFGQEHGDRLTAGYWQSYVLVMMTAFGKAAGIAIRPVPYKGAVEAQTDLVAERLHILFTDTTGAKPLVDAGTARVLAAVTAQRASAFPQTLTLSDLGYPVVISPTIFAVFAPANTPRPILDTLNAAFSKVVDDAQTVRDRMKTLGMEPVTMSVAEIDSFVKSELPRWAKMIADAGLQKE
jgi:tripartite-type tricarboxylate transporter receptor subunit TctC